MASAQQWISVQLAHDLAHLPGQHVGLERGVHLEVHVAACVERKLIHDKDVLWPLFLRGFFKEHLPHHMSPVA